MRVYIITPLVILSFISTLSGQDSPSLRLHLQGYNVVFPGIEVAYQYPIYRHTFNEEKQNELVVNIAPVIDVYQYKGNHTGIGLMGELNLQYIFPKGYLVETYGGFGMLEAILSGKVYELNDSGEFEESRFKGNLYSNWKTGFGFGKFIHLKSGNKMLLNLKGGIRRVRTPGAWIAASTSIGVHFLFKGRR